MKIFRGLLPWLNLVPFLFTVLAAPSPDPTPAEPASVTKSVPECAASPTEYYALPFEFWIETIFLKPYISPSFAPPIVFLPGNPVSIVYDYPSPFNESLKYGRAIITNFRVTQYFTLRFNDLHSPDDSYAIIWTIPVEDFPGYSPLAFDVYGPDLDSSVIYRPLYLSFTAVKKCTSTNETELILRATDFFNDNSTYFSPFEPFVH